MNFLKINSTLIFLMIALLATPFVYGQEVMKVTHSCNFNGAEAETEYYVDNASNEAIQIITKIMKANILPQNFIIN